jgi:hypothetical protein
MKSRLAGAAALVAMRNERQHATPRATEKDLDEANAERW